MDYIDSLFISTSLKNQIQIINSSYIVVDARILQHKKGYHMLEADTLKLFYFSLPIKNRATVPGPE